MLARSVSCSVRNLWRCSSAANSSSARGFTRPSWASLRSAPASRRCCSSRTNARDSPAPSSAGTSTSGPYSATSTSSAETQFRFGALDEPGDVELLLVDAQLEPVHVLGDRLQALAHGGLLPAHLLELLVAARALRLCASQRDAGLGDGGVHRGEHRRQ